MDFNIIKPRNSNEINKLVKQGCFNAVIGGNEVINRKALESKNIQMLLNAELEEEDFMHSKNSGLNQVLVKLAKKNNIAIGFSLNKIITLEDLERVNLLGKMMQNVMLCNKYKIKMYIINFVNNDLDERNINDLKDLGLSLGMPPGKFEIMQIKNE